MHDPTAGQEGLAQEIAGWVIDRLADRRATFPPREVTGPLPAIDRSGIGPERVWRVLRDVVFPSALPTDHPGYLAFVPGAASVTAVLADMALAAAGVYGGSELEGGAVVAAERAALRWLSDLIGYPSSAHGAFVSGGSMANLSALVVARQWARERGRGQPSWILAGRTAHASIDSAATVMGCAVLYDGDEHGRLDAAAVRRLFGRVRPGDVVAVVATAGATNTGAVDDLADVARLCARAGVWLHVDAAYGGGALLTPRCRPLFGGIERADSVTIDPHKWLFTPFDCAAVVYRDALLARRTHAQVAPYLEPVSGESHDNPADYALHLSRRARGIPMWASLLAHGTDAYRAAVEACLDLAGYAAEQVRGRAGLELVGEPSLSVVTFRRAGWAAADYGRWSEHATRAGLGLVTPTTVDGAAALRFCFVNPVTTRADVDRLLDDAARTG